ncbi:MAG: PilW family protein [Betaproteobacteria bacterium]|nr:PilW family protein [Betaproteobacteria bacterium]
MNTPGLRQARFRHRTMGFSIVELLVAVAVGLVLVLAVTGVLLRNEGRSRNTLAVNDVNQSGAFVAYLLDSAVRSAGSGFANRWAETYGCRLNASRGGSAILPRTAAWPAPFAGFPQAVRVAPVIIGKGQSAGGSDIIAVMRGNAGVGEAALEVLALGPPLGLRNTIGLENNTLLLLADGDTDCLLLQTTGLTAPVSPETRWLNTGVDTVGLTGGTGAYHTVTGTNRSLADFGNPTPSTVVVNLGNAGASGGTPTTAPQFTLYAVGANRTLFARDMLDIDGGATQALADGVVEMRALYGLDTDNNGTLDQWADPGVAPFDTASLLSGNAAAVQNLNSIIAVRIGLVLRTSQREREVVAPETLTLFADLATALRQTRTLTTDERNYRHRTTEVTVPLRNVLLSRTP